MKVRIDHRTIDTFCDGIIELIQGGREVGWEGEEEKTRGLRAELHDLVDRQSTDRLDGYPTSSLGGEGGSGQVQEVDDDGKPMRDPVTGRAVTAPSPPHGDPTSVAATTQGPVASALHSVMVAIVSSHASLAKAETDAMGVKPPAAPPPARDIWCTNHAQHGLFEPRGKTKNGSGAEVDLPGGLCWPCYRVQQAEGTRPPKRMLERLAAGERCTERLIAETMGSKTSRKK